MPPLPTVVAFVASLVLVAQVRPRLVPVLAVAASGLELALALRLVSLDLRGVPIHLVLWGCVAVAAAICWARAGSKAAVSAATAATVVAALQVLALLLR